MRTRYQAKVKQISTGIVRVRELLLDESQAINLKRKIGKVQNGYLLLDLCGYIC